MFKYFHLLLIEFLTISAISLGLSPIADNYRSAEASCHDGSAFTLGNNGACYNAQALYNQAVARCQFKCNKNSRKCGINSYSLRNECTTPRSKRARASVRWTCSDGFDYAMFTGSEDGLYEGSQLLSCSQPELNDSLGRIKESALRLCKQAFRYGTLKRFSIDGSDCIKKPTR